MIHVVMGPPCGGKSTYVQEHAKDGDLRVDYDLIAQALGAKNSHSAEGIIKKAAFDAREAVIARALKDTEADSWIIHTTPNEEHLEIYRNANADFIELDPGYDECMARAENDKRPQQTIDGIEKYYHSQKSGGAKMNYKEFGVKYDDEGNGTLEGYASTWIKKPDSYGDIVKAGAFKESLETKWNGGKGIPLLFAHQMDNLNAYIGTADANEDEKGLHFIAKFDDTPEAQRVRQLYKDGRLSKFSFAFDILDQGGVVLEDGTKANELRKLDIYEISCVCVPANDDAGVLDVKAGKRNSKKDADDIREAIKLLQGVLGELEEVDEPTDDVDEPDDNPAGEDPKGADTETKARLLAYINSL